MFETYLKTNRTDVFFFREWLDHLATSKTQFKKAILLGYSIGHGIAQQALLTSTKIYTNL